MLDLPKRASAIIRRYYTIHGVPLSHLPDPFGPMIAVKDLKGPMTYFWGIIKKEEVRATVSKKIQIPRFNSPDLLGNS